MPSDHLRRVLAFYGEPFASAQCVPFLSTGLSGAQLWRFESGGGKYVLRRWPDGQVDPERLAMIHQFMERATNLPFVPKVIRAHDGRTHVRFDEAFWHIETWVSGEVDLTDPPPIGKVAAAAEALARFHAAMTAGQAVRYGQSPALADRAKLLDEMLRGGLERLGRAPTFLAPRGPWAGIAMTARPWLAGLPRIAAAIRQEISEPLAKRRTLQPVIRDVTRDHLLFTGDTVTGLVDFGAMAFDHVTVDLARLAGSYGDGPMADLVFGCYAASKYAPLLTDEDRSLVRLLDRSGTLVAAYRWLRWIFVEKRVFDDAASVSRRIERLMARSSAGESS